MTATFDPSTVLFGALSGGNLTFTGAGGGDGGAFAFASEALSTGKRYFEMQLVLKAAGADSCLAIGISGTATLSGLGAGGGVAGAAMYESQNIWVSGSNSGVTVPGRASLTGDWYGVLVDLTSHTIQIQNITSGGGLSTAVTIPSGSYIPACVSSTNSDTWKINFGGTTFQQATPATYTAWDAGSGAVTGTFVTTEHADISALFGITPQSGTFTVTEHSDSWATSSGFTSFGVENPVHNNDTSTIQFTTNGPDRILVLMHLNTTLNAPPPGILTITTPTGLVWHGETAVVAGEDINTNTFIMEYWWAYAHNKVTNEALTVTESGGSVTLTAQWLGLAVKGMNGNFNYPFDTGNNPLSWGAAVGGFFGADAPVTAFAPYADGPFEGVSSTTPVFISGDTVGATLSGGGLVVTSTGSGGPNNYSIIDATQSKSSGKYYFEVTFNTKGTTDYGAGFTYRGVAISTFLSNGLGGMVVRGDGSIWNGSQISSLGLVPSNGDVIAFAIDLDRNLAWAKDITAGGGWNGSPSNNPTFGIGGVSIDPTTSALMESGLLTDSGGPFGLPRAPATPIAVVSGTSSAQQTWNLHGSFSGTVPVGFTSGWPAYTSSGSFHYPALSLFSMMSVTPTGAGGFGVPSIPSGFTLACSDNIANSRRVAANLAYQIHETNVQISDNVLYQGTTNAPAWVMLYDTIVQGQPNPGAMDLIEAPDTMRLIGYPGAFGFIGFFEGHETPDTMAAFGFPQDEGIMAALESPDIFGASGHQPIRGTFVVTEAHDIFAATGLGRGEDGTMAVTEGIDVFHAVGFTPIAGTFITTEAPDRFLAIGAGVTQVRHRRSFFAT